jgi:integrase
VSRALEILKQRLTLREQLKRVGRIDHDLLFFEPTGAPIATLDGAYRRWRRTLKRLHTIRYRKPYAARHCSVSWNLMVGKKPLWVAKQHGHSLETMLRAYGAWAEGTVEGDVKHVKRGLAERPDNPFTSLRIAESQIAGVNAWAEDRTAVACAP